MSDARTRHNRATYDRIAPAYDGNRTAVQPGGPAFPELQRDLLARLPATAVVADLGCGPGHDGARLHHAGLRVVGVDLSAGMLAIAAHRLGGGGAQGDLRELPLRDAAVDAVWCAAALLHVPDDDTAAVVRGCRRVLRTEGVLALVTALGEGTVEEPVPYASGESRWFVYRSPGAVVGALTDAGFDVVHVSEGQGNRRWGSFLAVAA